MAKSRELSFDIHQSTAGGVTLGDHWRGARGLTTRDQISSGGFDIVILQDHSMRAVDHPDSLAYFINLFTQLVKESGGTPMLYSTWARQWNPLMQDKITSAYAMAASQTQALLIPVGEAWALSRRTSSEYDLYSLDSSHPSTFGSYLNACIFFGVLSGQSPVDLPARLTIRGDKGQDLYLMILTKEEAEYCQSLAEKFLRELALIPSH